VGSHQHISPRLTPQREAYLQKLAEIGIGEPPIRGPTRHHLLKLGWIEGVYELADGRKMTAAQFQASFPPETTEDRWKGVKFGGVTLTDEGYRQIKQTPGSVR